MEFRVCVDSSGCFKLKKDESDRFRIDSGSETGIIMSTLVLFVYMDAVMKEMKMGMGRRGVRFLEDGRKWRLQHEFISAVRGFNGNNDGCVNIRLKYTQSCQTLDSGSCSIE